MSPPLALPPGFPWGVGTSAYQIECAVTVGGGPSIDHFHRCHEGVLPTAVSAEQGCRTLVMSIDRRVAKGQLAERDRDTLACRVSCGADFAGLTDWQYHGSGKRVGPEAHLRQGSFPSIGAAILFYIALGCE